MEAWSKGTETQGWSFSSLQRAQIPRCLSSLMMFPRGLLGDGFWAVWLGDGGLVGLHLRLRPEIQSWPWSSQMGESLKFCRCRLARTCSVHPLTRHPFCASHQATRPPGLNPGLNLVLGDWFLRLFAGMAGG